MGVGTGVPMCHEFLSSGEGSFLQITDTLLSLGTTSPLNLEYSSANTSCVNLYLATFLETNKTDNVKM